MLIFHVNGFNVFHSSNVLNTFHSFYPKENTGVQFRDFDKIKESLQIFTVLVQVLPQLRWNVFEDTWDCFV